MIRRYAAEQGLLWLDPAVDLFEPLSERSFDYLFSAANLTVLSKQLLRLPQCGAINFHDSLLPAYGGLHATSWALMDGVCEHGVTWHWMTGQVDRGDILKQRVVPVAKDETAFSLNKKCVEAGVASFAELIDELASHKVVGTCQDSTRRSYFSKFQRPPDAAILSWERGAAELGAFCRALDFGSAPNPLGHPKVRIGEDYWIVGELKTLSTRSGAAPGTILEVGEGGISIATATEDVRVSRLTAFDGTALDPQTILERAGVRPGDRMQMPGVDLREKLAQHSAGLARNEQFWRERLATLRPLRLGKPEHEASVTGPGFWAVDVALPPSVGRRFAGTEADAANEWLFACWAAFVMRQTEETSFDVGFSNAATLRLAKDLDGLVAEVIPVRLELSQQQLVSELEAELRLELARIGERQSYWRDLPRRDPAIEKRGNAASVLPVSVHLGGGELPSPQVLLVRIDAAAGRCQWIYATDRLSESTVVRWARQWSSFIEMAAESADRPVMEMPLLSDADSRQLLRDWNATAGESTEHTCKHELFEAQVKRDPNRVAVVFGDGELTYGELNARANQLAHYLRAHGVGPDVLVGICMKRSLEMVVALLAIFKAGGAYVPLDPEYPKERIAFMLEDSEAAVLLTQARLAAMLPPHNATVIQVDADWPAIERESVENPVTSVTSSNLAYVIYTSGSTGKPKGVMVEHRNVVNFFAGMDQTIGAEPPGVWLAVTSISFDISVLELFWTLTRGFKVVLQAEQPSQIQSTPVREHRREISRNVAFSLFYFATDEGGPAAEKYRLLLDGARFADANGFEAVWTPERHFHAFGGLYPNPSVTSAALAAITDQIQIRAGSVVLPLHHPVRVAEEWSVVDNLSKGRVGISFASGWQANDFVLAPDSYRNSKEIMIREIETVRKLWRGETVMYRNGKGEEIPVKILPRPIQRELPVWITAAGNPETFRMAGESGANVLTHLLGQSVDAVAEKIRVYRDAWQRRGHPGQGRVTLMLHTFVGENLDAVRETVRKPFSDYLRSSVDLIKNAPSAFPTFAPNRSPSVALDQAMKTGKFSEADMEALVAHAFDRYFETSALFGTPEICSRMVERLKKVGVDEVACLIDFGVGADAVLDSLRHLNELRERCDGAPQSVGAAVEVGAGGRDAEVSSHANESAVHRSVSEQIRAHGVTHLQCTPSMARMLLAESGGPEALGRLTKLLVGGEALPAALAEELARVVRGEILNMYGPTETTVWSTVAQVRPREGRIHIGRPIANTQVYVLDQRMRPVPIGVTGELFIGGAGVARGYWKRSELTAERFVSDPFSDTPGSRLYRTGDAVRYYDDGNLEFLGRLDNQVKVRGHRIELQEIESALDRHPDVRQSVVIASDEPASRLLGYIIPRNGTKPAPGSLRTFLHQSLPEFMVPELFVFLDAMPLTPNGKVNRRALPPPHLVRTEIPDGYQAPRTPTEEELAKIWEKELGLERAGVHDNFFDLGGNSLLAVQIAFRIRQTFQVELPLHTFFDRPTIAALAVDLEQKLMEHADDAKLEELLAEIEGVSECTGAGLSEKATPIETRHNG